MAESETIDTSSYPAAFLERRGYIGILWLNRPRALNAVNSEMCTAAGEALEEFAHDPELRVCVITGVGRAFSAGADLKEVAAGRKIRAEGHPEWGFAGIVRHYITKPVIAAVNGYALGGGTEIVLSCDLAVLDETAVLGLPEVKRGIFAGAGGVIRLPRQMPTKIALEVALTGDPITAAAALHWGLVNRVAPARTALEEALKLAGTIADNAPLSVRASKDVVHRTAAAGSEWDSAVWEINQEYMREIGASQDAREGTQAFAQKRMPVWSGR
jgi:enoyl-CoA hydratase/carnithine racemase